jgi:hypothetical protein
MSASAAGRSLICIGTKRKLLFTGRTGVRGTRGLGVSTALAQGQNETAYPESGAAAECPRKCRHPIHGRKAFWSVIVANEVPDQGSRNQAHTEMGQALRVEVAGLAPDLARNSSFRPVLSARKSRPRLWKIQVQRVDIAAIVGGQHISDPSSV